MISAAHKSNVETRLAAPQFAEETGQALSRQQEFRRARPVPVYFENGSCS